MYESRPGTVPAEDVLLYSFYPKKLFISIPTPRTFPITGPDNQSAMPPLVLLRHAESDPAEANAGARIRCPEPGAAAGNAAPGTRQLRPFPKEPPRTA